MWRVATISISKQLILLDVKGRNNTSFMVDFMYGLNKVCERCDLWEEIATFSVLDTDPICFLGDFNAIHSTGDSHRAIEHWPPWMEEFNDCINRAKLLDIRSTGLHFTWRTRVRKHKVDRALINDEWLVDSLTRRQILSNMRYLIILQSSYH